MKTRVSLKYFVSYCSLKLNISTKKIYFKLLLTKNRFNKIPSVTLLLKKTEKKFIIDLYCKAQKAIMKFLIVST